MTRGKSYLTGVALAALMIGVPLASPIGLAVAQVNVGVTLTVDTLRERVAPQGEFVRVSTVGEVWKPRGVPQGWQPYTRGNWIYNNQVGWYFNSDEPFAEVTYHYGRWYEDPDQGWVWVADTKWAPAWVEWRRNKQYVGWRPLPPENAPRRTRRSTTTVTVTRASPDFFEEEWIFVPANRIVGTRIDTVMIRREQVVEIYSQTEVVGTVEQRGGIYVNLSLQPAVLQRDANITIQSSNLPQVTSVPVPAQVQQISTETKATVAPAVAPAAASSGATTPPPTAATAPAATPPAAASTTKPAAQAPATATAPATTTAPATVSAPSATPAVKPSTSASTPVVPSPKEPAAASAPTSPAAKSSTSATVPAAPAPAPAAASAPGTTPAPAVKSSTTPAATPPAAKPPTSASTPTASPPSSKSSETAPAPKPPNTVASPTHEAPKAATAPNAQPAAPKQPAAAGAPAATTGSQKRPDEPKKTDKVEPDKKQPGSTEREGKNKE